jgi:putative ABC transport system permease protein
MTSLMQDLRYAVRQLRNSPGYACTAIVILALGVGSTTTIFSALDPILFKPLPYPHAERIMMIWYVGEDGSRNPQAFHTYRELAERTRSFDSFAVMKTWQPTLIGSNEPERIAGQQVSAAYFHSLGILPAMGRDFQAADDVPSGPKVVILSNGLWRRRFNADGGIIARQVRLDDSNYTVIGVMPAFDNVLAPSAELWSPLQYNQANIASAWTPQWGHHLRMVGRLRAGVSIDQAKADLTWIAKTPVAEFPRPSWTSLAHGVLVDPLQEDVTRSIRPALFTIFGAVVLVLLIACVNVTNLILARGAERQGEFAMRAALGAAPPRMLTQLLTESLLLAMFGSIFGLAVAQVGIRLLLAVSPAGLPRVNAICIDGTVFAFASGITALIGLAVGLVPAWHASHGNLQTALQQKSQRTAGTHQRTRGTFVVAEVALALVLAVSAGLLLHSLSRLLSVSPGFDAAHMLTMQVQTYGVKYDDDRICHQFFQQALDAVLRVPGVTAAAFTSQLPLSGDSDIYGPHFEGDPPEVGVSAYRYSVTPGYFEALRIPLRHGRLLDAHDTGTAPRVAVISESLAKRRFPNEDPIGKCFHMGGKLDSPLFTIVGVVGDVKQMSLGLDESDAVYTTTTQWHWADGTLSLIVRGRGDVAALIPAVKNAIWSVDRDQPVVRVALMGELLVASAAQRRFVLILFEAFGLIALLLAATGIYSVLSASVTERTREIGVRSALGAPRKSIVSLVVREGMTLTVIGTGIGLTAAAAASQWIRSMLFGVSCIDPLSYLGVMLLLSIISAVACAVPAWRAAEVDPMAALRYE